MKSSRPLPLLTLPFLCLLVKFGLDLFVIYVSPESGIYGIDVSGSFFSDNYWLSWFLLFITTPFFLIFSLKNKNIFGLSIGFLYISTYFPALTIFWATEGKIEYISFCTIFWLSLFTVLTFFTRRNLDFRSNTRSLYAEKYIGFIYFFIILVLIVSLLVIFGIPSSIGFESVYERRKAFSAWIGTGTFVYLFFWSVYVFACHLIFFSKVKLFQITGLFYVALFYLVAGDKVYLLLLLLVFSIRFFAIYGGTSLFISCFISLITFGFLGYFLNEVWIPFIVNRFLALPAGIAHNYISFFDKEPLFYSYSFLSSFFNYSYSDMPVRLIGSMYYSDGDNANLNFLTDAYLNFGWFGIFHLVLFFTSLQFLVRDPRCMILLVPLFVQLIDAPLPTALLTGGGGIIIFSCFLLKRTGTRPPVPRSNVN